MARRTQPVRDVAVARSGGDRRPASARRSAADGGPRRSRAMKVTFVLPGASHVPAGGPRMVFRYANALAADGWPVTVVMPADPGGGSPGQRLLRRGRYWWWFSTRGFSPSRWLTLDPRVQLRWTPDLHPRRAPAADVVVATAVRTAEAVATWPARAGRKFYLVQGYETWDFPATRVESSWRLPLRKLAVSRWLCDLIAAAGERAVHLPNGLDHEAFGLDRPPEMRRDPVVLWPHHPLPQKGSADALAAAMALAATVPALQLQAYGTGPGPRAGNLRVNYVRNPPQAVLRALYNQATVAVAPSHSEGWGLPACEALQCGCALAASDVGGHREFLQHEHNALLHTPGDVAALRENIHRLLTDEPLRLRLARQGLADMAGLRFEPAVERLKLILQEECGK
jgi:glycosyltransferase involved in cell wall biosynthesis